MESSSRFSQWTSRISDKLSDQVWFQQLKAKWDELDAQNRTYVRFAVLGVIVLILSVLLFSSMWRVHSLKNELTEKREILTLIQNANDELKKLREASPAGTGQKASDQGGPWPSYFESIATTLGLEKSNVSISSEKPGAASDLARESLFEISLKHVNIKQVVRYAFQIESGSRPVKLRNLSIDTKSDPAGYMDATVSVSAFTLKSQ